MKNLFALLFVASMLFVACGDDCTTCTIAGEEGEICDNGDGTVTSTAADGTTSTDSLTLDEAIALAVAFGGECN